MSEHEDFQQSFDRPQRGDFKLPKIEKFSQRGCSKQTKNSTKLPNIKADVLAQSNQGVSQRRSMEDEDLVGQVQKRLRLIMEQRNIVQITESEESDGDNFQMKIKENKQIIKQTKKRNQRMRKQNSQQNREISKKLSQKAKYQGPQKRFRDLKEVQIENRPLKKKKELNYNIMNKNVMKDVRQSQKEIPKPSVVLKQISNSNIREVKSKDQFASVYKIIPNQIPTNRQPPGYNRKIKKQFSQKLLAPPHKNEQLFEGIPHYLQNPKGPQIQACNQKLSKQKPQLQQKLKQYQLKLSKNTIESQGRQKKYYKYEHDQPNQQTSTKVFASTPWRKVEIADSNWINEMSSFDRQIDRIGLYLHRNQKSLEKYIQNQKQLIDVQMSKRQGQRERYKACQRQDSI